MEDTRTRIIQASIKSVREDGLEGVRIQSISKRANLSPGTIYRYFESKDRLMEECFFYVDKQVAEIYDNLDFSPGVVVTDPTKAIRVVWLPYFRFWITHPDETIFYYRFRDSAYFPAFDERRDVSYFKKFAEIIHLFMDRFPRLKQISRALLWNYILTFSLVFAKYVIQGVLPDNKDTEDSVFQLLVSGLSEYLKA